MAYVLYITEIIEMVSITQIFYANILCHAYYQTNIDLSYILYISSNTDGLEQDWLVSP